MNERFKYVELDVIPSYHRLHCTRNSQEKLTSTVNVIKHM